MLRYIISLFICIIVTRSTDGQTCGVTNGGCDGFCVPSGSSRTCSCPCGQTLGSDQTSCIPAPCNIKFFITIDMGKTVDLMGCSIFQILTNANLSPPQPAGIQTWKNNVIGVLNQLQSETIASRSIFEAVAYFQYVDRSMEPQVLTTFANSNLGAAITSLSATNADCGTEGNYFRSLNRSSYESDFYVYPGSSESPTNIAIVFTSYTQYPASENTLLSTIPHITSQYDGILVVQTTNQSAPITPITRSLACNSTTDCPNIFYFDTTNSIGLAANSTNLLSRVNLDACEKRRNAVAPTYTTSCESNGIVVTIPKCLLKGLTSQFVQFRDPSCTVTFNDVSGNVKVTVAFLGCGLESMVVGNKINYFQELYTRSTPSGLPSVHFNISCSYQAAYIPSLPSNVNESVSGVSGVGLQLKNISFGLYLQPNYTIALAPGSCIQVNCPVYFQITANVPPGYFLSLSRCIATPSANINNSTLHYSLFMNGCPVDSSFRILPIPNNHTLRFSMSMFEFASSYSQPKDKKLPVHLHCYFMACLPSDVSQACKPNCPSSRRRRSIDTAGHIASFGPFYVETGEAVKSNAFSEVLEKYNVANIKIVKSPNRIEYWQDVRLFWISGIFLALFFFLLGKLLNLTSNMKQELSTCDHFVLKKGNEIPKLAM